MPRKLTDLEESIVIFARETGQLAELCQLVDYDPDIGRVTEHWIPKVEALTLAKHLMALAGHGALVADDEGLDLRIENLVDGFRNYGYKGFGEPVPGKKLWLYLELKEAMKNAEHILEHARGTRAQKLKILHERLPEPCFSVSLR